MTDDQKWRDIATVNAARHKEATERVVREGVQPNDLSIELAHIRRVAEDREREIVDLRFKLCPKKY